MFHGISRLVSTLATLLYGTEGESSSQNSCCFNQYIIQYMHFVLQHQNTVNEYYYQFYVF